MAVKFNLQTINYINIFSNITKTNVKDCIVKEEIITFIINQNQAARAIGKQGKNVKRLSNLLKKRIKIIEYNQDPARFVANLISPIKAKDISKQDSIIIVKTNNFKEKSQIYGREKTNFKQIQEMLSKFFSELKIKLE